MLVVFNAHSLTQSDSVHLLLSVSVGSILYPGLEKGVRMCVFYFKVFLFAGTLTVCGDVGAKSSQQF